MKIPLFLGLIASLSTPLNAAPGCHVTSPERQTALLELYTSEGCSSCPPTEAWLARLPEAGYDAQQLIPIALHVDYWDYIGWKDPYANPGFTQRQKLHASRNRLNTMYTPQLLLNGNDLRPRQRLKSALSAQKALASIQIELSAEYTRPSQITVTTRLASTTGRIPKRAKLYLALAENSLSSSIKAGENIGRKLRHEHVVRKLLGPRHAQAHTTMPIHTQPDWVKNKLELVAFVESDQGAVLQAVRLDLSSAECHPPEAIPSS